MKRKTLYDLSWKVAEGEYRADKALSYSTIAKYEREGFSSLNTLFDSISTPSLLFGSVVDTLMTDKENFDNLYVVSSELKLSDNLVAIVDKLYSMYPKAKGLAYIPDDVVAQVGKEMGYYAGDSYTATRVKKIKDLQCARYFQQLQETEGKSIITSDLYQEALECVNQLMYNPFTSKYFYDPFIEDENPEIEAFNQLKFKGVYNDIPVRMMMDRVIVDHKNKRIIPIDLKTSFNPEYDFPKSYVKWLYMIQSNLYTEILKQNIEKDELYKDYTITDYLFIVVSRSTKKPLVWRDKHNFDLGNRIIGDKEYRNWRTILPELYNYLSAQNPIDYPYWVKPINDIDDYFNNNIIN